MKSEDEKLAEEQEKECKLGNKKYRITMMFSATMSSSLEKLVLRLGGLLSLGPNPIYRVCSQSERSIKI
jgi:hypothetical protein